MGFNYVAKPGAPADEVSDPSDLYGSLPEVAVASRGFGLHIGPCTGASTVKGTRHGCGAKSTVALISEPTVALAPSGEYFE